MPPGLESASLGETVVGNSMYIEMIQMITNVSPLSLSGGHGSNRRFMCLIVYASN